MELNSEQTQKIADMLGEPKVKWSRAGAFFCSMRTPEMDALVDAGALRVEETIEPWGPCVTYVVTDGMRNRMAAVMLSTNAALTGSPESQP